MLETLDTILGQPFLGDKPWERVEPSCPFTWPPGEQFSPTYDCVEKPITAPVTFRGLAAMSDLLSAAPVVEVHPERSARNSLEAILTTLAELEWLLLPLAALARGDETKMAPGDRRQVVSERLRIFASRVLVRAALPLIDDLLDDACAYAAERLRRRYGNTITPDAGWDDALQETRKELEKRLRNLAVNTRDTGAEGEVSIGKFRAYAWVVMHKLVLKWRRRASSNKSLSAVPGGEASLAARPSSLVDSGEEEVEAFCKFLDQQAQPDPALPMSQVLRVYRSHSHERAAAAKHLDISENELRKHLTAIGELAKRWSR